MFLGVNSEEFTTVPVLEDIVFLPVDRIEEWRAMTFSWCSPLGARLRSKRWIPGVCALIRPTCEPAPLLQVAARRGFYKIPKQGLLQIGRHVDAPLVRTDLLPKVLLDLCTKVLGPLSDEIQLEILRHRIARRDDATDFLQTEEAKEMLEKDDVKMLEKEAADDGEMFSTMKESVKTLYKKIVADKALEAWGAHGLMGPSGLISFCCLMVASVLV